MGSIIRGGGVALALVIFIIVSSSYDTITIATARSPYNSVRLLADCNSPIQGEVAGCGGGGGSGGGSATKRCRKGCCAKTKWGSCKTCCS